MWRIWQLFKTQHQLIIATLCLCHPSRIRSTINELFQRQHLVFVWLDPCIVNISSISFGSIQNCRVCYVQTSRPMFGADEWIKTLHSGSWFTAAPIQKTERTDCIHVCKSWSDASPCRILKTRKWWRKRKQSCPMLLTAGMCLCYILPQCLPDFTIFSLLAVNIRAIYITFGIVSIRDVRAYCIVLQFWFNITYFLTQECMKHDLVKHSNHLHRPT